MPKISRTERAERRASKRSSNPDLQPHEPNARVVRASQKPLRPLNEGQALLASSIQSRPITFALGRAGTGKTYIAASMGVEALMNGDVDQIVITRPVVPCGEDMGFLPGELEEKYQPWMEPVLDVLEERLGSSTLGAFLKNGRVVGKPLQFMRGKTLKRAWIIMDEAQNTTPSQMKMFLTRFGHSAKCVIDGDLGQSDLVDRRGVAQTNGLEVAIRKLRGIPEIGIVELDEIVRHDLVAKILQAYES